MTSAHPTPEDAAYDRGHEDGRAEAAPTCPQDLVDLAFTMAAGAPGGYAECIRECMRELNDRLPSLYQYPLDRGY